MTYRSMIGTLNISLFLAVTILSINLAYAAESEINANNRQPIHALYIPLADHFAALVAYERYRAQMVYADFRIEQMKNWDLLRAYFQSGDVDMAYVMSPLATDMYSKKPDFRWIGLMHRDGNALAIIASLEPALRVINYQHLNVDKKGLQQIMDLAVQGGILQAPVDIDKFADLSFAIELGKADE